MKLKAVCVALWAVAPIANHATAVYEVKIPIFKGRLEKGWLEKGWLEDALGKVRAQRQAIH